VGSDAVTNGTNHELTSYKTNSYTYKDERLTHVDSGTDTYDLAYDALGRCVKRVVNGVTKYYIYDGERPILEYRATGGVPAKNLYGKDIDEILMRYDPTISPSPSPSPAPNPRTFYYQQDHEGSVRYLTDAGGNRIEEYRYDVFGTPTIYDMASPHHVRSASIVSNRFMFTGREYAAAFKFYEYRARAYNPELGRFMSEDPKLFVRQIGPQKPTVELSASKPLGPIDANNSEDDWSFDKRPDEAEINLFRYCSNDPLDLTDPMGLFEWAFSEDYPHTGPGVVSGRETVQRAINTMDSTKKGAELQAVDPGRTIVITPATGNQVTGMKGNILFVNPKDPLLLDPQSRRELSRYPGELPAAND